jgi:hypothetical protein
VQDDSSGSTGGAAYDGRDCPEKDGSGQPEEAPAESETL